MVAHVSGKNMFQRFLHSQVFSAFILIGATAIALVWANSQWGQFYYDLSHTYMGVSFGEWEFKLTLSHWIKDGLMAIFFFVVGLEIKREIVVGELSSIDKALLPVCAAVGGAIVPAALYAAVNMGSGAIAVRRSNNSRNVSSERSKSPVARYNSPSAKLTSRAPSSSTSAFRQSDSATSMCDGAW